MGKQPSTAEPSFYTIAVQPDYCDTNSLQRSQGMAAGGQRALQTSWEQRLNVKPPQPPAQLCRGIALYSQPARYPNGEVRPW